jgi:hypothetical protein
VIERSLELSVIDLGGRDCDDLPLAGCVAASGTCGRKSARRHEDTLLGDLEADDAEQARRLAA